MDTIDRQIRYFLKIAELSSLSKAAEDLDVSQSGLSRQLARSSPDVVDHLGNDGRANHIDWPYSVL